MHLSFVLKPYIWASKIVILRPQSEFRGLGKGLILESDVVKLFLCQLLKVQKFIVSASSSPDELV